MAAAVDELGARAVGCGSGALHTEESAPVVEALGGGGVAVEDPDGCAELVRSGGGFAFLTLRACCDPGLWCGSRRFSKGWR